MYKNDMDDKITSIILDSISDGVFTVDYGWKITSFNKAAEYITGVSRDEAIGRHCYEVFKSNMCERDCALRRTMERGESFVDSDTYIVNRDRKRIPVTVSTSLLKDPDGNIIGGVETFRDMSVVEELRRELKEHSRFEDMISNSPSMKKIFNILPQIAKSGSTILIKGETGTGKELLAKALHELSGRKGKPFVTVNCSAIPDNLLESEIFGYKKGAFTDAIKDKPGYFLIAEGGTIFLDEIGDISQAFQAKLLRVLQDGVFRPLGSTKALKSDIRIIAATNKDLSEMVEKGIFRQDLYYRINVIKLKLPPLRDRREDIPLLVDHFIEKQRKLKGRLISGISHEALTLLMEHDFPGNIRELENIIEHASVLCQKGQITKECLPENIRGTLSISFEGEGLESILKKLEAQIILSALKRNNNNKSATAKELGIHKSTLFRKMDSLGIKLQKCDSF